MAEQFQEVAVVVSQKVLATDIYSLWIQVEHIAKYAKAGQFLSLYTGDGGKLLPRPISICEIKKKENQLRLVYRVTGVDTGTSQFAKLKTGEYLRVLGPLGNGFPLKEKSALLIGGGVGIPPILELAKSLSGEKQIVAGYKDELFLTSELKEHGQLYIATEDGSTGSRGNVLDIIKEKELTADVIYACGPIPMLVAIKKYALKEKITCYLSLEENMACGIGACLACVCKTREKDNYSNVNNTRICKEGPVFLSTEVELC